MVVNVPHLALRYLLRWTATPEVTTNDLVQALLDADGSMRDAFLNAVGTFTGRDFVGCRIEREAYTVGETTGKAFTVTSG